MESVPFEHFEQVIDKAKTISTKWSETAHRFDEASTTDFHEDARAPE